MEVGGSRAGMCAVNAASLTPRASLARALVGAGAAMALAGVVLLRRAQPPVGVTR